MTFMLDEQAVRAQATHDGVTHFATGIAIAKEGKLLVVRRVAHDTLGGLYELPGGGVDDGESFAEGAIRETLEETGLTVQAIVGTFEGFDYATRAKLKVRQINFVVTVQPGEVVLEPNEHDDYRWITPDDIAGLSTSNEMKQCMRSAFAAL